MLSSTQLTHQRTSPSLSITTGKTSLKNKKLSYKSNMKTTKFYLKLKEMIARELTNIIKKLKLMTLNWQNKSKKYLKSMELLKML